MARGIELATAYVTITAETSKVPKAIDAAIQQGGAAAPKAGRSIGSNIAAGLGTALKAGATAAGGVAALALGTALTKGFERVTAIDDAKGKLAGLGHDAQGVATIMDSALASVKGTAFGLGDAAGIAASAVAAGIKPGEQLTKYLSLTADAATIAGSSLGEMGAIMNKVSTSGKAYTDNLNQLADRGIPIFQWLQEEYGVTAEELSKMVKEGKVDAETFRKVIEENIGGAALESGKTLRGSFANMQAALGRIGAAAIEPFLPMMKSGLAMVTEWADKVTPKVKAGAEGLATGLTEMAKAFQTSGESVEGPMTKFEAFGIKAREITDGIAGVWAILSKGDFRGADQTFGLSEDSKAVEVMFAIRDAAIALWAALTSPSAEKFTEFLDTVKVTGESASGAMGKVEGSSNNLAEGLLKLGGAATDGAAALLGLGGDTAQVAVTGIKAAGNVMGFFADNTTAATAALAALAGGFVIAEVAQTGFHIARIAQAAMTPAEIASRMAMTRALIDQTAVQRAYLTALGAEVPAQQATMRQRIADTMTRQRNAVAAASQATALGVLARAHAVAATQATGLAGAMHRTAAGAATAASRIQGLATVGMGGLRTAASGLMTMLGGPFGLALAGVATGLMIWHTQAEKTKARNQEIATSAQDLGKILHETNGILTETGTKAAATALEQLKLAGSGRSLIEYLESIGVAGHTAARGLAGSRQEMESTLAALEKQAAEEKALNAERIQGEGFGSTAFGQLLNWGGARDKANERQNALADFQRLNEEARKAAESQERLKQAGMLDASGTATDIGTMSEAMARFAESTGGAASKVDILNGGLSTLRGDQLSVEDAQQKVNDAMRAFSEAAANGGYAAISAAGQIDTGTAAGSRLYDAMKNVQNAFDQAGAAAYQSALQQGQSHADAAAAAEAASQRVRDEFIKQQTDAGMALSTATALADQYRLFPADIRTQLLLTGTKEAEEALRAIEQKERIARIKVAVDTYGANSSQAFVAATNGMSEEEFRRRFPQYRASGGPLFARDGQVTGAGGPTSDSVFAMLSDDEHVWSAKEVEGAGGHGALARMRAMARQGLLPAFATGGPVVMSMVNAVKKRFPGMEFTSGLRYTDNGYHSKDQAADFSNTGAGMPSTPQMQALAAWIADNYAGITLQLIHSPFNRNIGQGQGFVGDGVGFYGSGTMAEHQDHVHWAVSQEVGEPTGTSAGAGGVDGLKPVEWTEKDQIDLESARVAVIQAKEARDKTYANEKKSDADKAQADLKVQRAELKVRELENKRDGKAGVEAIVTPAPELTGEMDEDTLTIRRAEIAILDAQLARDKTYSDPEATSMDKEKADLAVYDARNNLESTKARIEEAEDKDGKKGSNKDGWTTETLRDRVASYGSQVAGILFDSALEIFGVESRWLDIPWPKYELESENDKSSTKKSKDKTKAKDPLVSSKRGDAADGEGSPPDPLAELLGGKAGASDLAWPMPATAHGRPAWIEQLLKKGPKVYDSGGWLEPGEMGINLGKKPEPVFTPDEFDNIAQIAAMDSLEVAPTPVNDFSIRIVQPTFANESRMIRSATDAQRRQMMRYGGRMV